MTKTHTIRFTILLIFIFIFVSVTSQSKTIVVVLDNSASMIDKNDSITQCTTSNYALQLLISTLNIGDSLYLILSQKPTQQKVVQYHFGMDNKQIVIKNIGDLECYDAYMIKPLLKGIDVFNKIVDNNKQLILIGDGRWFGEKDKPTSRGLEQLTKDLSKIAAKYELWYINTADDSHLKNGFYNSILKHSSLKKVKILETNSDALELMEQIEVIIKSLLNLPEDDFSDYELKDGNIIINNKIPLDKIYIIDQYIGEAQEQIGTIQSKVNELKFLDKSELKKNNLKANFYVVGNESGLIGEDEIKISISGELSDNRKLKIYAINTFGLAEIDIIGDIDAICKNDKEVVLIYKLKQKKGEPLTKNQIDNLNVIATSTSNKKYILEYDSNKQYFAQSIILDTTHGKEVFKISAEIPNYFSSTYEINITKQTCRKVNLERNYYDTLNFSMLDTAGILEWKISPPKILNHYNTNEILNNEFDQIIIKSNIKPPYSLTKADNGFVLKMDNKKDFFTPCLMSSDEENISFIIEHPNAETSSNYHITIIKTDTGLWERCYRVLIALILCILFLIYLYAIVTKHRFKKGEYGHAMIVQYNGTHDDDEYFATKPLKTGPLNRYLNPFERYEKNKVFYMNFRATRGTSIILMSNSISSTMYQDDYGAEFATTNDGKKENFVDHQMQNEDIIVKKDSDGKTYYEYKI